jgi:hypothetical protein
LGNIYTLGNHVFAIRTLFKYINVKIVFEITNIIKNTLVYYRLKFLVCHKSYIDKLGDPYSTHTKHMKHKIQQKAFCITETYTY